MKKLKFFLNFEKEEKWLNDMAAKGYVLTQKNFGYRFRKTKPHKTVIKIDFRQFKTREDFEDYRALFEDSGWKHIAGTKSSGTQYFKRISDEASEDIFSDSESKAGRYKRLAKMYFSLAIMYLPVFIALLYSDIFDYRALMNPKLLYFTPGLWEKTGIEFLSAFLFETPFAFMRGFAWWFFPASILLFLVFSVLSRWQYKKSMQQ